MEFVKSIYLNEILNQLSDGLLIPTMVLLVLFIMYAIYLIGSIIVEQFSERRRYRAYIPEVIAKIVAAQPEQLPTVIEESSLLRYQKDDLLELLGYLYLPTEAREAVARRLLRNEQLHFERSIKTTARIGKMSPALGVMGTLIPLGPALEVFGQGDYTTFATNLAIAFSTTVTGLGVGIICQWVTGVREIWYDDYMVSTEAMYAALLEKAQKLHERGYTFPAGIFVYDNKGKKAHREPIASVSTQAYVDTVASTGNASQTQLAQAQASLSKPGQAASLPLQNAHGRGGAL